MTKTIGIYQVTSNFGTVEDFKLVGASSQIEVCTRDYMSWCKKGKAPKTMQAEYDRVQKDNGRKNVQEAIEPAVIFKVNILKACKDIAELDIAKTEFGLSNKGGKPKDDKPANSKTKTTLSPEDALAAMGTLDGTSSIPAGDYNAKLVEDGKLEIVDGEHAGKTVNIPIPEHTAETNWEALFNEYKGGRAVKDICEELGVSKSTFYNKTKSFK